MVAPVGRLVIAAPSSSSGKTTAVIALLAGLSARGRRVQSFKVGPDYIDGTFHAALTGRPSRNLDLWMGGPQDVLRQFTRGMKNADLGIIEGVMGMMDSGAPEDVSASTADVARVLNAPVVLVLDGSRMAESAAAIVHGFHTLPGSPGLAGVILNRMASARHYQLLESAIAARTGVPVLGYLPDRRDLALPERHLGLVPAPERQDLVERAQKWADAARETLNWHALEVLADQSPALPSQASPEEACDPVPDHVPIALAYDEAFHFYYQANLDLLTDLGGELLPFSPLRGDPIPQQARVLYVGGGFPEEFLGTFRGLGAAHRRYRRRIDDGLLTLAECGGYIWLSTSLRYQGQGEPIPMVGVVPAEMQLESRLQGLGYRTAIAGDRGPWMAGARFRGHEFHHTRIISDPPSPPAWHLTSRHGEGPEGFQQPHVQAGFTHLYFPSNTRAVRMLLEAAASGTSSPPAKNITR